MFLLEALVENAFYYFFQLLEAAHISAFMVPFSIFEGKGVSFLILSDFCFFPHIFSLLI